MGQSCSSPKTLESAYSGAPLHQHPSLPKYPQTYLPGVPAPTSAPLPPNAQTAEPPLPIHVATFSIRRHNRGGEATANVAASATASAPPSARSSASTDSWKRWYSTGRELGKGISAVVYEAEALSKAFGVEQKTSALFSAGLPFSCGSTGFVADCMPDRGRRVAVKRFKKLGTRSFHTELSALVRVGAHPNVLRLLESYEDCEGEDALILEYCDGCTVFDAYAEARKKGHLLPELLVARIVRQLLLGLEHIFACGVEHQDIKPENMLLYSVSLQEQRAEVKIADFGWATATTATAAGSVATEAPPKEGAGSLWYAPPELNPPVSSPPGGPSPRPAGRTDMWSVGVVIYLLLVGSNPFNAALKLVGQKAIEDGVIQQVAQGQWDSSSSHWLDLQQDARDFINAMIVVEPSKRLAVAEALRHPYLVRRLARCPEAAPPEPAWSRATREDNWAQLDGFQRLAWAAVSRSISEPELSREVVATASRALRSSGAGRGGSADVAYIWHLARELSSSPVRNWLAVNAAWAEVLRLAFRYLDSDGDGILSPQDLVTHLVAPNADAAAHADVWSSAHLWVSRWCQQGHPRSGPRPSTGFRPTCSGGLVPANFRAALMASCRDTGAHLGENVGQLSGDEADADGLREGYNGREEELCGWNDIWARTN